LKTIKDRIMNKYITLLLSKLLKHES